MMDKKIDLWVAVAYGAYFIGWPAVVLVLVLSVTGGCR